MGHCRNFDGRSSQSCRFLRRTFLVSGTKSQRAFETQTNIESSLGVAESGLFPGVVFYLSNWYKRNERQYRISLFFSCASLAGAFGGILAWGISHMRGVGGYAGWRWIFILVRGSFCCFSPLADNHHRRVY
jgi:MFS family permease